MDQLNFYYLQRVLESELDLVQANVGTALAKARQDLGIVGVHDAGVVAQNAPPDLNVLVSGPALGTDPDGERVSWPTQQTVDCSQDHLGASTSVVNPGNERWISVIAEYDQTLATPVTDGNGVTVYTRIYDSFNIYVTMGVEAAIGVAVRPALPTDGILLADVNLVFGGVQILTADIDNDRRQDLVHTTGANIPTFYHGDLVDAVVALFGYVDGLVTGAGIVFAATESWRDASSIAAVTVSGAINEIVADLSAFAGAARTGVAAHATVGNYCDIADGALQTAIDAICDAVAGHINGGAPAHPDTGITAAAIAGAPESFAGGFVRDVEEALYVHINARTERSTDETIDGAWVFGNSLAPVAGAFESVNVRFFDNPLFKTIIGGSTSPYSKKGNVASGLQPVGMSWSQPWGGLNETDFGGPRVLKDIKMCYMAAGERRIVIADETALELVAFDPMSQTVFTAIPLAGFFPVGVDTIEAICTDEAYVYVKVLNSGTGAHYINALDLTGTIRTGWPATGTNLAGVGTTPLAQSHTGNLCVATMDANEQYAAKIATVNDWQNGGSGLMVTILNAATGAILASGDGDVPLVAGPPPVVADMYPQGGICSDGVNIWFTWRELPASTIGGFATATIANPLVGSGYAGLPPAFLIADSNEILFDGECIWYFDWSGDIQIYRVGDQVIDKKNGSASIAAIRFAAFDGLNMWIQQLEAGNDTIILNDIPTAQVTAIGTAVQNVADMLRFNAGFMQLSEAAVVTFDELGRVCFDGDSVWMIMQNVAGDTLSGIVRKLPRAGLR